MNATTLKMSMAVGAITLLAGISGNAGATTSALTFSNCGDELCASFTSKVNGTFSNDYTFSVTDQSDLDLKAFSLMKIKKSRPASIEDFNISLWRYTPTTTEFLGDATSFSTFGWDMEYPSLSSGDYFLRLTGTADSNAMYHGRIQLALAPVPEASTWIMMLAGIGLVGLALHRKTKPRAELIVA